MKDCKWAIKQDPSHLKAYIQAAKSLILLSKPAEALEMCDAGLRVDSNNPTLMEVKSKAENLQASIVAEENKKLNALKVSQNKLSNTYKLLAVSFF